MIFNKHEYDFHNFKIIKFMKLIHAKSIGFWWGHNIHDIFFKNDLSEMHN